MSGPIAVNRSRPRLGRGPGLLPPPRALPAPAAPQRQAPRPAWPQSPRRGPGWGRGGGSPAENPPAGRAAQGEGLRVPEWRIRKGSGSTRARPARGILGKKWPRRTGREQRGAEVRGQGPGVRRAEPPPPTPT